MRGKERCKENRKMWKINLIIFINIKQHRTTLVPSQTKIKEEHFPVINKGKEFAEIPVKEGLEKLGFIIFTYMFNTLK